MVADVLDASLYVTLNTLAACVRIYPVHDTCIWAGMVVVFDFVLLILEMQLPIPAYCLGVPICID